MACGLSDDLTMSESNASGTDERIVEPMASGTSEYSNELKSVACDIEMSDRLKMNEPPQSEEPVCQAF